MPDSRHAGKSTRRPFLERLDPLKLIAHGLQRSPALTGGWIPPDIAELAPLLPDFELLELVGRGGMGTVYQARQKNLGRLVAIKLLPVEISADEALASRFQREAQTMARLQHPNLVTVFTSGETVEGHFYFVMEFVAGEDLQKRLRRGPMECSAAVKILREICDALEHAHQVGIIHRDIKPSNVLLDGAGQARVADFGLAILKGQNAERLTRTGAALGTLEYSAPEQTDNPARTDQRSDIYSVGVMAFEMLTGQLPRGVFDPPSKQATVDWRFDEVILRALQHDPEKRFPTVAAFREALLRAQEEALISAVDGDLLSGAQAGVIEDFYRRAMEGVGPGIRRFIEDELLTRSGFRESRALEDALERAGTRDQFDELVERRLLRLVERGGSTRVEIAHDRLTGVIQASRDARRAREQRTEADRREREIRRQLRRRNQLAAAMITLALAALVAAFLAWRGDRAARTFAAKARLSRSEAESLVAFMTGQMQFNAIQLGRLDLAEKLLDKVEGYYTTATSDPADLNFQRNKADFYRMKGNVRLDQAQWETAIAAYQTAAQIRRLAMGREPNDIKWKLDLAEDLNYLERAHRGQGATNAAVAFAREKKAVAEAALARSPTNFAAWEYVIRSRLVLARDDYLKGRQAEALQELQAVDGETVARVAKQPANEFLIVITKRALGLGYEDEGRHEEARASYQAMLDIAKRRSAQDPADVFYQTTIARASLILGGLLEKMKRPAEALPHLRKTVELNERFVSLSPGKVTALTELATAYESLARVLQALGQSTEAGIMVQKQRQIAGRLPQAKPSP